MTNNPYDEQNGAKLNKVRFGYGITIDTVQNFLFKKHLNPEPQRIYEYFGLKLSDELSAEDFSSYLYHLTIRRLIQHYYSETDDVYLFYYPIEPFLASKHVKNKYPDVIMPNSNQKPIPMGTIYNHLINAFNAMFIIPDEYQIEFEKYVKQHVDQVIINDKY